LHRYKTNTKTVFHIHQQILINTGEENLRGMTEDQLEMYLYRAKMLTENLQATYYRDIRQYFPCKNKTELDPGEGTQQQDG
jgi:hypothetical protein